MSTRNLSNLFVASLALILTTTGQVYALPTQVSHQNVPFCDQLFIPTLVDEIGDIAVFPADEALTHQDLGFANPVCLPTDDSLIPDALVSIRNASGRDFDEVWYVADPETGISNIDGVANDLAFPGAFGAFRIDRFVSDPGGAHHPLISESATQDGIWEAGEEWQFVLQDYTNTKLLPPDAITSRGVGAASLDLAGFVESSGSIIAIPSIVPEPSSLVLVLCGLLGLGVRNRS